MFSRYFCYLVVIGSTIQLSTKIFFFSNCISVCMYKANKGVKGAVVVVVSSYKYYSKDHSCQHIQKICVANNRPSRGCVFLHR